MVYIHIVGCCTVYTTLNITWMIAIQLTLQSTCTVIHLNLVPRTFKIIIIIIIIIIQKKYLYIGVMRHEHKLS